MTKDEALNEALIWFKCYQNGSMSRNNAEALADEVIEAIHEALAQPKRDPWRAAAAQPEQRPVAWEQFHEHLVERNFCPRCGKRLADLGTIHTCTPPIAAGPEGFYGLPQESVSTPNAGGKCVTDGETSPTKEIDPNQWAFDRGLEST